MGGTSRVAHEDAGGSQEEAGASIFRRGGRRAFWRSEPTHNDGSIRNSLLQYLIVVGADTLEVA